MIIELVINRGLAIEVDGHTPSSRFSYSGNDTTLVFGGGLEIAGMTIFKIEIAVTEHPDGINWYGQIHEDFDEYEGLDDEDAFDADDGEGGEVERMGLPSHVNVKTDRGDFSAAIVACAYGGRYIVNKIEAETPQDIAAGIEDEDEYDDEEFTVTSQSGREFDIDDFSVYLRADT